MTDTPTTESAPVTGLAEILADIARGLQAEADVEATLAAIVKAAVDHVDGAEYAGICLVDRRGRARTVAPTSELVTDIDALQHRIGEGPCLDAVAEHTFYRTGDLSRDTRWPAFTSAAAEIGMRSFLSYRLFITDTTLGALNLYSTQGAAFSEQTAQYGQVFAAHAAIALASAQNEAALNTALEHRDVIGMAKGVLMQRHDLDPARAFRMLVEASQNTNLKLHQVAAWLVDHRGEL